VSETREARLRARAETGQTWQQSYSRPACRLPDEVVDFKAGQEVKSPYPHSVVNPNQITQSLIAVLAGLRVPFVCTETHEMGEEILASYLYQVHLYQWLEKNGFGFCLMDGDL
jgi:hypothetical protein